MRKTARVLTTFLVVALSFSSFLALSSFPVEAAISSCTATVSPNTMTTYDDALFTFTVENTDSTDIKWIKVTRPSDKFNIYGGGVSGWNLSLNDPSDFTLTNGTLSPGNSQVVNASVYTTSGEAASADWTIQVSDQTDGSNPFTCTGTIGTAIEGAGVDTYDPVITNVLVSEVADTSVKVTWTTDENSNSVVEYGTTTSYGSTKTSTTQTTSHSVTVTGLTKDTTYHYRVKSTDASGNEGVSGDDTFVTSQEPTTTTTTVSESGPTVTSISAAAGYNQATITWTTGSSADGQVEYGLTSSYGQSSSLSTSLVTSHSVTISGLKTNTTYHYQVKSKTSSSALSVSSDQTFTTQSAPVPVVSLADDGKKITSVKTPEIKGTVNSVLASQVEVSLNGGATWVEVGKEVSGTRTFTYTPASLEDDNYTVVARAIDTAGQEGKSEPFVLVVDTTAPQVGGMLFSVGPQILYPSSQGIIYAIPNMDIKVNLSAIGGPIESSIFSKEESFELSKNIGTGLWSTNLKFANPGIYDLSVRSLDGAGNETIRELGRVSVAELGRVTDGTNPLENAEVTLYVFEPTLSRYIVWDGPPFNQQNPQNSDAQGNYEFFVPKGKYYLEVDAKGFVTARSNIFEVDEKTLINTDIALDKPNFLEGLFAFTGWVDHEFEFNLKLSQTGEEIKSPLVGKVLPDLKPLNTQNKALVEAINDAKLLVFLNTWLPTTTQQLAALEDVDGVVVVMPHETQAKVDVFAKRGGYKQTFVGDPDGILVGEFELGFVPAHYFVKEGVIEQVKFGVLSKEEILDNLK